MSTILWLIGILGGLGGGLWIVSLFVPSVAAVLAAVIRFLGTPVGQAVAVVVLCALSWFGGDIHGSRVERAKCEDAQKAAERAAFARDVDEALRASEHEATQQAELDRLAQADKEHVDARRTLDADCHPITREQLR